MTISGAPSPFGSCAWEQRVRECVNPEKERYPAESLEAARVHVGHLDDVVRALGEETTEEGRVEGEEALLGRNRSL